MESKVYNQKGKEVGKAKLPEAVFGVPWSADLVHQVARSLASNARMNTAHTKNRGEVQGTGKKPWQQKGTGRARHGSRRSPIWRHGGVAFGPRNERNFTQKINKKMSAKALRVVLSRKLTDKEIVFLDELTMLAPKSKEARNIISALGGISGFESLPTKKKNAACVLLTQKNQAVEKSFRNFGNVAVREIRNINVADALRYKYLVIVNPEKSFKILLKEKITPPDVS